LFSLFHSHFFKSFFCHPSSRLFLARLASVLALACALGLLLGGELLDAVVASSELLGRILGVRLLEFAERSTVERQVFLLVASLEELTRDVGALTLGSTELVTFELSRVGERLLGGDRLRLAGLLPRSDDVLLGECLLNVLGARVGVDLDGEGGRFDVLDALDVAPHALLLRVLDQNTVGVNDGGDDTDLVRTWSTEDTDEAADLDVVCVHHFCVFVFW